MQKIVSSGKAAMDKIKAGVDLVANPVRSTISPMGKTVIISESFIADYDTKFVGAVVTKDGYKITQHISSPDVEIQAGVLLIQTAAAKQMSDCGDGTSSVCLLTQALLDGGLKLVAGGANRVDVVNGINKAVEYVCEEIRKMAIPINGDVEKIRQVATVCSNNDEVIGGLIAKAFEKIGVDGVIKIEESKGRETEIKITNGITFGIGWASQYFINNPAKSECILENPYILIYDRPIIKMKSDDGSGLLPLMLLIADNNNKTGVKRPLLVLCDAIDGEALATLTANANNGNLLSCAVEMRTLGDKKREFLEDVSAATGGSFLNELKGEDTLEKVTLEKLGQAEKVVIGKEETTIMGGYKDEKRFNALSNSVKELSEKEEDPDEKELLKKRLARLNGSVAVLSVGGVTKVEMEEKRDRADDAVRATRSSIESGFVPGGGTSFVRIPLPIVKDGKLMGGYNLVFDCLGKPLEQICINAGIDSDDIILKVTNSENGYNVKTGKIENLVESGIIEPAKSNICALQNAASVVCQILSSDYMITSTL